MQFTVGVYDEEGPPVPIPNTVVKLFSAENTWRAAARENRSTLTLASLLLSEAIFLLFSLILGSMSNVGVEASAFIIEPLFFLTCISDRCYNEA